MSSISKYSKGYRAQVFVKGVRDSATFRIKREAEAWAFQREAEIRSPKPAGAHTLAEALIRYREEVSPGKRGERWEIVRISAFLKEPTLHALRPMADLTPEDLGRWRDARLKVVTPGTVLREIALLSAVLETARREWQWLPVNPLADMRKPKAPDHREVTISPWQAIKMLKTMGYRRGPCRTVYESFESDTVAKSGIVPMPGKTERLLGGHAVLAVGYNQADQCLIVRNSWGSGWGDKGYFTLPYGYVTNRNLSDDFWVVTK